MPSLSYYALQKAIYEKLTGSSQLIALAGIFDHTPQGTAFPFVAIGDAAASDLSSLGSGRMEYRFNIHIWSREAGHKQASDIMEVIYGLLHNGSITVTGQMLVMMSFISSSIQLEDDGWTYHGTMRLRVVLTSN